MKLEATHIVTFSHLSMEQVLLTAATIIVQLIQLLICINCTLVSMYMYESSHPYILTSLFYIYPSFTVTHLFRLFMYTISPSGSWGDIAWFNQSIITFMCTLTECVEKKGVRLESGVGFKPLGCWILKRILSVLNSEAFKDTSGVVMSVEVSLRSSFKLLFMKWRIIWYSDCV